MAFLFSASCANKTLVGESEDGYIPSEHEIISLHLFLSMIYLDRKNPESAHVEPKRAIEYLANNPDGKETTFDDAAIRIWLAGLWEAIGDRNSSDVDLRKAMELSSNSSIEKLLLQNKRKVKIIFQGLGPRTNWSNSGQTFLFDYHLGKYGQPKNEFEFSTRNWYDWHQNRNTKIRESLTTSHYMANSLGYKTSRFSQRTVGLTGAGIMYTAGAAGWLALEAENFYKKVDTRIEESKRNEVELLKIYRMIRFLPSSIEYVDENLAKSKSNSVRGYRKTLGAGDNQVEFIWNPE